MILLILHRKADIEAQDDDSYTPLLDAVSYGQQRATEVLLERGAAVDVIDRDGKTIVFIAAEENHVEILEVIYQNKLIYLITT